MRCLSASIPAVSTFAILSLVIMVVIVGVVAVVARQLWQTLRHTIDVLRAAGARLQPLADELQAELAVTSVEAEVLRSGVQRLRQPRRRPHRSLAQLLAQDETDKPLARPALTHTAVAADPNRMDVQSSFYHPPRRHHA